MLHLFLQAPLPLTIFWQARSLDPRRFRRAPQSAPLQIFNAEDRAPVSWTTHQLHRPPSGQPTFRTVTALHLKASQAETYCQLLQTPQVTTASERYQLISTHQMSDDFGAHPVAESLIAWFTQNGGQLSPDVQVVYSKSHGFHMRARGPLSSPVVATCPLKLTLSILNLDPDQKEVLVIESPLQQCRGKIPDHILTYLLLIEQRKKGQESPWHAYIACLPGPESMTTPLWFDDADMVFLAGTSLAPAAKERKTRLHEQWEHAVTVMKELDIAAADEIDL
jgi:hypothetical protein